MKHLRVSPPITLEDLMPPHVLEKIAWPHICKAVCNGLQFGGLRVTYGPVTGCCRHFGHIFTERDITFPLSANPRDPIRSICDMIARHWQTKILVEVGNRRHNKISITLDHRWIPTEPRTFWQRLRGKPAKRLRSEALELMFYPPCIMARISYVIDRRD